MSGFLENSEIERLFARDAGDRPGRHDGADQQRGRRARWLRTVDFTRPTKFSTDQERRIRRTLDGFCERVGTRLNAEHRTQMEMEVIDVGQFTWADAFSLVPDRCIFLTLDTAPHTARMLLIAEVPVVLTALERMLGGRDATVAERELTDIDLMVAERLMGTIVAEMSQAFFDVSEMTFGITSLDTQAETVQVAAGSEPTLVLTFETRLEGSSATMSLLIPHQAIAPVAHSFSRRDEAVARHDPEATAAVHHGLRLVDVTVRAEVGGTNLTVDEVLSLAPGDIVRLDAEAGQDITICVDRTPIHQARAGRSGKWRATQITRHLEVEP